MNIIFRKADKLVQKNSTNENIQKPKEKPIKLFKYSKKNDNILIDKKI